MAEILNPMIRVTAHYFTDEITDSERISRWYTRDIDFLYNTLRCLVPFNVYEPEMGEIDYDTSYQVLLKGIAVVPADAVWWKSYINEMFNEMFKDEVESEYLDWLILTNQKLKNYRKGEDAKKGKVGITFITLNDGETFEAEIEEGGDEEDFT